MEHELEGGREGQGEQEVRMEEGEKLGGYCNSLDKRWWGPNQGRGRAEEETDSRKSSGFKATVPRLSAIVGVKERSGLNWALAIWIESLGVAVPLWRKF